MELLIEITDRDTGNNVIRKKFIEDGNLPEDMECDLFDDMIGDLIGYNDDIVTEENDEIKMQEEINNL